jgi:hypothetical protein
LRYAPPQYYVKLQDFKGALTYFRWFKRNFPDDVGEPSFLFEWTVTLYKNGKLTDATEKAFQTFAANTYVIDKFLNRPFHTVEGVRDFEWQRRQVEYLTYNATQDHLKDFALWLESSVNSAPFRAKTEE